MKNHLRASVAISMFLACSMWAFAAAAEEPTGVAAVGRDFFVRYCSACHGQDGTGVGEFANLLKKPPADLTKIAARRGGTFPSVEVAEIIDGRRTVTGHGTKEMPIWGERFSEDVVPSAGMNRENLMRGRVLVLVEYLRSIQAK